MPDKRGYACEEKTYGLPAIWINEEELAALFIASRLASNIPDRRLKSSFKSFLEQIVPVFPTCVGINRGRRAKFKSKSSVNPVLSMFRPLLE
jgi:hypothetical protein